MDGWFVCLFVMYLVSNVIWMQIPSVPIGFSIPALIDFSRVNLAW